MQFTSFTFSTRGTGSLRFKNRFPRHGIEIGASLLSYSVIEVAVRLTSTRGTLRLGIFEESSLCGARYHFHFLTISVFNVNFTLSTFPALLLAWFCSVTLVASLPLRVTLV